MSNGICLPLTRRRIDCAIPIGWNCDCSPRVQTVAGRRLAVFLFRVFSLFPGVCALLLYRPLAQPRGLCEYPATECKLSGEVAKSRQRFDGTTNARRLVNISAWKQT